MRECAVTNLDDCGGKNDPRQVVARLKRLIINGRNGVISTIVSDITGDGDLTAVTVIGTGRHCYSVIAVDDIVDALKRELALGK